MLGELPWMQPPPHGKALDSGLNPKNNHCMYTLPQGVFSETLNYSRGAKIRPELSCLTTKNSYAEIYRAGSHLELVITDKGAAQLLEVVDDADVDK
jgi:hypothetical protein